MQNIDVSLSTVRYWIDLILIQGLYQQMDSTRDSCSVRGRPIMPRVCGVKVQAGLAESSLLEETLSCLIGCLFSSSVELSALN